MKSIPATSRAAVTARDHGRCRWCGTPSNEQHHIVYRSQGGSNDPSNLITLCGTHHALVHSSKRTWMPILIATLKFHEKGMSLTVPQVQRWLGQEEAE